MIAEESSGLRKVLFLVVLAAVLVALVLLSLGTGSVHISPSDVMHILLNQGDSRFAPNSPEFVIVREIRPPRVALAVLVGAALALSGAVMQGLFQNPMADPYIIGVSSGAALGASTALSLSLNFWFLGIHSVSVFAFGGALLIALLVYGISIRDGRTPTTVLLLTGIAIGSLAAALTSLLLITSSRADLHRILFWLMGSLSSRRWEHVNMIWPYALAGTVVIQLFARDLNLLLQGEESAQYMGVRVELVKRALLVVAALLTAAAVAVSGIIGFVGLVVPHFMRMLTGPDHRSLFPASVLGGAILLVGADMAARTLISPAEIPLGVITSLLGCPFFLFLLRRRRELPL